MQTGLSVAISPAQFSARIAEITQTMQGHAAHRAADLAMSNTLRSLGYSDGVDAFEAAVMGWHDDAAPYPRPPKRNWRCGLGFHRWVDDPDKKFLWIGIASVHCLRCGVKGPGSRNPCP
jgi:hypothetical protein